MMKSFARGGGEVAVDPFDEEGKIVRNVQNPTVDYLPLHCIALAPALLSLLRPDHDLICQGV